MPEDKHLDRWRAAKEAFSAQTGREIQAYALVMIDTTGEVHWGGDYSSDAVAQRELLRKLEHLRGELKRFMKETAEEGAV
jgi:hypothetical protein